MSYEVLLDGLNCGSCASKIQSELSGLDGVLEADVNMATSTVKIELDDGIEFGGVLKQLKSIVRRIEPHVKVVYQDESIGQAELGEDDSERSFKLKRIAFGAVLFAISFLIPESSNVRVGVLTFSYLFVGADIVERSFRNILSGDVFDENFLMTIATFGAILIGEYPEAVAVMLFYQVGESFQDRAVDKSRKSIKSLLDIRPDSANVKRNGELVSVSPNEVRVGDTIVVRPGEKIPLDGRVIDGETRVNTSALTGESVPRKLRVGDQALSGFLNETGLIEVEVTKPFGESTVSKILDLVQNASSKKAPTENFITKFARYYTPAVVGLAGIIAFIVPVVIGESFSTWIYRSLVFLVISCPCALVVSIPLGFFGGIGASSKSGILIKGGNYLEALNDVDCVVMDKTGTLTEGVFEVQSIGSFNGFTEDEILELSAVAEVHTNHPIGKSIVERYGRDIDQSRIAKYEEISGHGIDASIDGRRVIIGNEKLMKKYGIDYKNGTKGGTVVLLAVDGVFAGRIYIDDALKGDAVEAIAKLKKRGISEIVMLTGDSDHVAKLIAQELGIDSYYSELLPEDKVDKLEEISDRRAGKGKIAFVGDGINDAPVLARADIGISMGGLGSDAAIEASDIVIMTDEPSKISKALDIAKRTKQIVVQNIVLALGVKLIVLGLGTVGIAGMWEAVFADVGVSLIAILNSIRVLKMK